MKKQDKEERITFKMLWNHPFYNSLMKLGIWFVFFLILYIVMTVGSHPKENIKKEEDKPTIKYSYIDMKKDLLNNELSINYTIGNYLITGLINNNILTGTLEDNDDNLVKIKYDGNNLYQIKKDEENINNELLSNVNLNYLLPSKIMNIIDDPKVIGLKSADELTYSYNIDNVSISVYLNESRIEKIIILDNDLTYNLEYKEVVNEK